MGYTDDGSGSEYTDSQYSSRHDSGRKGLLYEDSEDDSEYSDSDEGSRVRSPKKMAASAKSGNPLFDDSSNEDSSSAYSDEDSDGDELFDKSDDDEKTSPEKKSAAYPGLFGAEEESDPKSPRNQERILKARQLSRRASSIVFSDSDDEDQTKSNKKETHSAATGLFGDSSDSEADTHEVDT